MKCDGVYFRQTDEDKAQFPYEYRGGGVWYVVLRIVKGEIATTGYSSGGTGKADLLKALKARGKKDLLGVWNGEWRTDLFKLDVAETIKKIEASLVR